MNVVSGKLLRGVVAVSALWCAGAQAADAPEVALITQAQGNIQLSGGGGAQAPAVAFSKLRAGTKVDIADGSRFQFVYLTSGKQETWGGAAQLEIGDAGSKALKASMLPTVKQLPAGILKGLSQAPTMIADVQSRQGMIRVRAVGDWGKIEDAEKTYKALRGQSAESDVTPELFLLATLSELKLFDKMREPMEQMLARQPDNAEIRALHEAYVQKIDKR